MAQKYSMAKRDGQARQDHMRDEIAGVERVKSRELIRHLLEMVPMTGLGLLLPGDQYHFAG